MKACLHIYTGDGKGKTTAAAGLAARAAGQGMNVGFFQFLKHGVSGEVISLTQLGIDVFAPQCGGRYDEMTKSEQAACQKQQRQTLQRAIDMVADYDLLVLDEVIGAAALGLVEETELISFAENRPDEVELVFTGRDAGEALCKLGDYVTEMRAVSHPHDDGQKARAGIEY